MDSLRFTFFLISFVSLCYEADCSTSNQGFEDDSHTKYSISNVAQKLMHGPSVDGPQALQFRERPLNAEGKKTMNAELLIVIDNTIYNYWLTLMNGDKEKAINDLKLYFTLVVNGVKAHYEGIQDDKYEFTVSLAGFYIAETLETDPYDDTWPDKNTTFDVVLQDLLYAFKNWVIKNAKTLPKFDIATVFTRYKEDGTLGATYGRWACTTKRVSVITMISPYHLTLTYAHELGHSLGAKHDGDGNDCSNYIMQETADITKETFPNLYQFSSCSVDYFKSYITELDGKKKNCLTDGERQVREESREVGEKYSMDEQCKRGFGKESYHCTKEQDGSKGICEEIKCYDDVEKECVPTVPAERSFCAANSWCIRGECKQDDKAG